MELLDVVITDQWLTVIIILIVIILGALISKIEGHKRSSHEFEITSVRMQGELNKKTLLIEKIQTDTKGYAQDLAIEWFEEWKIRELGSLKKMIESAADDTAKASLQGWLIDNEKRIRHDAAHRSLKVNLGKVTEHLLPFSHLFNDFNPKDARFIGSPIDLIVFDGVCDKKEEVTIYFIEVKTGNSALSKTQIKIRTAIKEKRVEWIPISLKDSELNLDLDV